MSWSSRAVLLALLLVALWAAPASAHGVLVSSDPANGAALSGAPGTATLRFNEPVTPRFSLARLVDGNGRVLADRAAFDGATVRLPLPRLGAGVYGVAWRVFTGRDGHTTEGIVLFTVGSASIAGSVFDTAVNEPGDLAGLLRVLLVIALVCGIGVAARSLRRAAPPVPPPGHDATRRRLIALAAAVLLLAAWPQPAPPPAVAAAGEAFAGDLLVTVSVSAGGACAVTVASSRRPPPAPVDRVTIGGNGLRPIGPGRYLGTCPGTGTATVTAYRGGARLDVPVTWSHP
ncbi:copper resistance CopC family protein [Nonomuraea sediminis]|uniref:copper resistance CopC family protein n=1 Tax=Nonomuraea sediminis TaxID=2835864 RepID=UPI001BDBCEA7|nr:copper resistance CopC family protein [Nonomuraea sediminis]